MQATIEKAEQVSMGKRYLSMAQSFSAQARLWEQRQAGGFSPTEEEFTIYCGNCITAVVWAVAALEAYVNGVFAYERRRDRHLDDRCDPDTPHRHTSSMEGTLCAVYQNRGRAFRHFGEGVVRLIHLRNQYIHYDNELVEPEGLIPWRLEKEGGLRDTVAFFDEKLRTGQLPRNPFLPAGAESFPFGLLSSELGRWACERVDREIDAISRDLGLWDIC